MFSDDVVSILVKAGCGVATGPVLTILVGAKVSLPSAPDRDDTGFLTIAVTGGGAIEGTHNSVDLPAYVHPSAQVVARATKYSVAESLAARAFAAIFPIRNQFVNGTWWRSVTMIQSEPFDLGVDKEGRPRLAFNFTCVKRLSPATS